MESSRVDTPGPVGSPLTTAMRAPGGSTGGTDHCKPAVSADAWATAPPGGNSHNEAATRAARGALVVAENLAVSRIVSSIFPPDDLPRRGHHYPAARRLNMRA